MGEENNIEWESSRRSSYNMAEPDGARLARNPPGSLLTQRQSILRERLPNMDT